MPVSIFIGFHLFLINSVELLDSVKETFKQQIFNKAVTAQLQSKAIVLDRWHRTSPWLCIDDMKQVLHCGLLTFSVKDRFSYVFSFYILMVQDAWLDSIEVATKYAGKDVVVTKDYDDVQDLSSDDIGKIKRRIADVLEPGETVLHALRRLKGTPKNKKEKMSAETKIVFDQLTEDAMNLMDNGESNVYHEKKEIFEREAEGYESLARARREPTSISAYQERSVLGMEWESSSDVTNPGAPSSILPETAVATSSSNATTVEISSNGDDTFDMFAEDDEHAIAKPSEGSNVISGPNSYCVSSPSSNNLNNYSENGVLQNDYVFDESSGYYYSSSLGYYYDPSTGLYCSASSGLWYSFNEETGIYDEIHQTTTTVS